MTSGVYEILNLKNQRRYVGSSCDAEGRLKMHFDDLECGRRGYKPHVNKQLQAAWLKHGAAAFSFDILLSAPVDEILDYEQSLLDRFYDSGLLYNISRDARSPMRGRKHTEEARRKMSEAHRGKPMPPFSPEHCQKISKARKGSKHTSDSRALMSRKQRGKKRTEETKERMAEAARNRDPSSRRGPSKRCRLTDGALTLDFPSLEAAAGHFDWWPTAMSRAARKSGRFGGWLIEIVDAGKEK